jgi:hypothetical protein
MLRATEHPLAGEVDGGIDTDGHDFDLDTWLVILEADTLRRNRR